MDGRYSMGEAAKKIGVHKLTLYRWEKEGKIPLPPRIKRNNQRVYTDDYITRVRAWKDETVQPQPGATG